jgi:hypothetical protein
MFLPATDDDRLGADRRTPKVNGIFLVKPVIQFPPPDRSGCIKQRVGSRLADAHHATITPQSRLNHTRINICNINILLLEMLVNMSQAAPRLLQNRVMLSGMQLAQRLINQRNRCDNLFAGLQKNLPVDVGGARDGFVGR